ncbi:MAG TPA: STAS domain-containing protein [Solirubrobacteraceae bacterium]|nr:STAS domain-containing protein [Solirubrobacteraceae bacterium]
MLPPSGELDLASAEHREHRVVTALRAHRRRTVIDLAEVQFIDCAGLNALLRAHERAGHGSQPLIVRNVSPQAQRLFELVQVAGR